MPRSCPRQRLARSTFPSPGTLRQRAVSRLLGWVSKGPLTTPRLLIAVSLAVGVGLLFWRELSEPPPRMIAFDQPVPVLMFDGGPERERAVSMAEDLRERAAKVADPAQPPVTLFVHGNRYSVVVGPYLDLEAASDARRNNELGPSVVLDLWGECVSFPLFLGELADFPAYFCQPPKDPTAD